MKQKKQTVGLLAMAAVLSMCASGRNAAAEAAPRVHSTHVAMIDGVLTVTNDEGQAEDHLFDGTEKFAAKAKETSEVNLDKSMLSLAGRRGGERAELANKLNTVVVRSYEFGKEGDYDMADVQTILRRLDGSGWKHLVRTRDGKELTEICVKQDPEGVTREMVIITAEPRELSLIHLTGNNLSMDDMHHIGGVMNGAMHGSSTSASSTTSSATSSTTSSSAKLQHHP